MVTEPQRADIASLGPMDLASCVSALGQPSYRAKQLLSWLYGRVVPSFEDMTDLPAGFRSALAAEWTLQLPEAVAVQRSADGTRKYLWRLADGATVESVGIPAEDRLTVCFSTQAGCTAWRARCGSTTRDRGALRRRKLERSHSAAGGGAGNAQRSRRRGPTARTTKRDLRRLSGAAFAAWSPRG